MKKFISFILLIWMVPTWAALNIDLVFENNEINQGSIETATLNVSGDALQKINLQKLKGKTIGETLYLHEISPLVRKEGSSSFESQLKIIFTKIPPQNSVSQKIENEEVIFKWIPVKVNSIEVPEKLIFKNFEIPKPIEFLKWASVVFIVGLIGVAVYKFKARINLQNTEKNKKRLIKERITSVSNYEEVVNVWKNKTDILLVFPSMDDHFKELEKTLFKVQFKPFQTEEEKKEVVAAYRNFITDTKGELDGI